MRNHLKILLLALPLTVIGVPARAQSFLVEGGVGAANFIESAGFDHVVGTGGARWYVTPRVSLGPEFAYFRESADHRDLLATFNVTFDLKTSGVTPYVLGGLGIFRSTEVLNLTPTNRDTFTSTEGGFTAGAGLRVPLSGGWYVAPEIRTGWEPHIRVQVLAGYRWN